MLLELKKVSVIKVKKERKLRKKFRSLVMKMKQSLTKTISSLFLQHLKFLIMQNSNLKLSLLIEDLVAVERKRTSDIDQLLMMKKLLEKQFKILFMKLKRLDPAAKKILRNNRYFILSLRDPNFYDLPLEGGNRIKFETQFRELISQLKSLESMKMRKIWSLIQIIIKIEEALLIGIIHM